VALDESYIELASRENIKQPFLLIEPLNPVASVIVFAGSDGFLDLGGDGTINKKLSNFLVRSRYAFAHHGLRVVVFEVPSHKADDFGLLGGYRRTKDHAKDIEVVVDYVKAKDGLPVWLIGTSRGSPSASNGAARLSGKVDGVVLMASVSTMNNKGTHVFETDLSKITAPAFVASHKGDECHVTPPSHVKKIAAKLKNSLTVKTMLFEGGDEPRGRACGAHSEHGFIGIEEKVVSSIVAFIQSTL
jgi:pimeloyl-ACP methyl ester carboxylesterase